MKKIQFIIPIKVGFGEVLSGGVLVMHKLAYELAKRGYKVIIFTNPEYPHENIQIEFDSDENNFNFNFDPESTVIIPSHNWNNVNKFDNVARWILYHIEEIESSNIEDTDEIFNYGSFSIGNRIPDKKLTVFDYKEDFFYNKKEKRERKYCYITNKNHPENWKEIFENYYNADNLTDWKIKGYEFLAEQLNRYEYLLTYDDKSFYTLAATMCGTKVILLGSRNKSNLEYRTETPYNLFGVACGEEDIEWAEKTIDLVPLLVNTLKEENNLTVGNFIKYWEEKIYKNKGYTDDRISKKICLISSYCNTEEKIKSLDRKIDDLKNIGLDVMVYSPIPLPLEITEKCDFYFYTRENPVFGWPEFVCVYWRNLYNSRFFEGKNNFIEGIKLERYETDYGWAGLYQLKKMAHFSSSYEYDIYYFMVYDTDLSDIQEEIENGNVNSFFPYTQANIFKEVGNFMSFDRNNLVDLYNQMSYSEYSSLPDRGAETYMEIIAGRMKEMKKRKYPVVKDTIDTFSKWRKKGFFDLSPFDDFGLFFRKNIMNKQENFSVFFYSDSQEDKNIKIFLNGFESFHVIQNFNLIDFPILYQEIKSLEIEHNGHKVDLMDQFNSIHGSQISLL